jgi:hypothetical protein
MTTEKHSRTDEMPGHHRDRDGEDSNAVGHDPDEQGRGSRENDDLQGIEITTGPGGRGGDVREDRDRIG